MQFEYNLTVVRWVVIRVVVGVDVLACVVIGRVRPPPATAKHQVEVLLSKPRLTVEDTHAVILGRAG